MAITSDTLTANGDSKIHFYNPTLSDNGLVRFQCDGAFATAAVTFSWLGADGNFHDFENGGPFTALASKTITETAPTEIKATMSGATGGESVYIEIRDWARG